MNRRMGSRNTNGNFLTRRFEIPAWLIGATVIVLLISSILENITTIAVLIAILIFLILIWLLRRSPTGRLKNVTLTGLTDHIISLSDVPEDLFPELLPISEEEEQRLRGLEMDGVGSIASIAGNLVFYDQQKREINSFPTPIRLTYNITSQDEASLMERKNDLRGEIDKVELIPIYLYTYPRQEDQEPKVSIWKPFQNYRLDETNNTVTIEFRFWGDQQTGYGTKP